MDNTGVVLDQEEKQEEAAANKDFVPLIYKFIVVHFYIHYYVS